MRTSSLAHVCTAFALLLSGASHASPRVQEAVEPSLFRLSDQLAAAISTRDADRAARGVREDDHVAYVSDGVVIRGREYREVLGRFYAGLREIGFRWTKREVRSTGPDDGVVTGWATIETIDASGAIGSANAIFTLVYARRNTSWELVTAHKTTLR